MSIERITTIVSALKGVLILVGLTGMTLGLNMCVSKITTGLTAKAEIKQRDVTAAAQRQSQEQVLTLSKELREEWDRRESRIKSLEDKIKGVDPTGEPCPPGCTMPNEI